MSARDLHVTRALLQYEFKSSGRRKLVKSAGGHPCDQNVNFWHLADIAAASWNVRFCIKQSSTFHNHRWTQAMSVVEAGADITCAQCHVSF